MEALVGRGREDGAGHVPVDAGAEREGLLSGEARVPALDESQLCQPVEGLADRGRRLVILNGAGLRHLLGAEAMERDQGAEPEFTADHGSSGQGCALVGCQHADLGQDHALERLGHVEVPGDRLVDLPLALAEANPSRFAQVAHQGFERVGVALSLLEDALNDVLGGLLEPREVEPEHLLGGAAAERRESGVWVELPAGEDLLELRRARQQEHERPILERRLHRTGEREAARAGPVGVVDDEQQRPLDRHGGQQANERRRAASVQRLVVDAWSPSGSRLHVPIEQVRDRSGDLEGLVGQDLLDGRHQPRAGLHGVPRGRHLAGHAKQRLPHAKWPARRRASGADDLGVSVALLRGLDQGLGDPRLAHPVFADEQMDPRGPGLDDRVEGAVELLGGPVPPDDRVVQVPGVPREGRPGRQVVRVEGARRRAVQVVAPRAATHGQQGQTLLAEREVREVLVLARWTLHAALRARATAPDNASE